MEFTKLTDLQKFSPGALAGADYQAQTGLRALDEYKKMDIYRAVSVAEGFAEDEPSEETQAVAWQFLHDTGHAYRLQGWFGRTARELIEQGVIAE